MGHRDRITPVLAHLHCLPICFCAQSKVLAWTFKVLYGLQPACLKKPDSLIKLPNYYRHFSRPYFGCPQLLRSGRWAIYGSTLSAVVTKIAPQRDSLLVCFCCHVLLMDEDFYCFVWCFLIVFFFFMPWHVCMCFYWFLRYVFIKYDFFNLLADLITLMKAERQSIRFADELVINNMYPVRTRDRGERTRFHQHHSLCFSEKSATTWRSFSCRIDASQCWLKCHSTFPQMTGLWTQHIRVVHLNLAADTLVDLISADTQTYAILSRWLMTLFFKILHS